MKFSPHVTKSKATDDLRNECNSRKFVMRLIGRLEEAIPGIGEMAPAARSVGHVHMLADEDTGTLAMQVHLTGITPKSERDFDMAAQIITATYREAVVAMLPKGIYMDLFVCITPTGGEEPWEVLTPDIEGSMDARPAEHTD